MSLETWREEFYPIEAKDVHEKDALQHSIKKWEGLSRANLDKHGVVQVGRVIMCEDGEQLSIDSSSCALCCYYIANDCARCPLTIHLDHRCDSDGDSPYQSFSDNYDASPMQRALKGALKGAYDRNRTGSEDY